MVGLAGLFVGLWLSLSLGWAFVVCSAIVLLLGIALASIESEVQVADTEEPEAMQTEPPEKVVVKMRSPFAPQPAAVRTGAIAARRRQRKGA